MRDGGNAAGRQVPVSFFLISMFLVALVPHASGDHLNQSAWLTKSEYTENFFLTAGDHITLYSELQAGQYASATVECTDCTITLSTSDSNVSDRLSATIYSEVSTILTITLETQTTEYIQLNQIIGVSESISSSRPAPDALFLPASVVYCVEQEETCLSSDINSVHRSILNYDLNHTGYQSGIATSETANHFSVPMDEGQTLEFGLVYADSNVEVELYWQYDSSEEFIATNIESSGGFLDSNLNREWFTADENGRLIFKIRTFSPLLVWGFQTIIHSPESFTISNTSEDNRVHGHGITSVSLPTNFGEAISISPYPEQCNITISEFILGNFTSYQPAVVDRTSFDENVIWVKPNSELMIIRFICDVIHTDITTNSAFDVGSGLEAPSLPPMSPSANNSSYPFMQLNSTNLDGYFVSAILDNSDVYRIEIDAWEDSVHFMKYKINSNQLENLSIRAWSIDETGSMLDVQTRNYSNLKLELGLEVPRGTQYFQVFLREEFTLSSNWGENGSIIPYTVSIEYSEIDEGEEPWFPPSDEAVTWGNNVRWILGFSFLIPILILFITSTKMKADAKEFASKKNRLDELRRLIDSGEKSPQESLEIIEKAMVKLRLLDWEESVSTWGKPDADYLTEDVQICVWKLGKSMATTHNGVPMMIGIHILERDWEIAGLRFDAPQNSPFEVKKVSPEAMFHGEEVFLDGLSKNTRLFLLVELNGNSSYVDVELNGKVESEAMACRIPVTIDVTSEE